MAMGKGLFEKLNKIQDLFSSLGYEPIELPKIVVVGTQSAGKSSVLESLVKRSFLPRGTGVVTRCPLVLQLNYCPMNDRRRQGVDCEEWGEFLHDDTELFWELDEVCGEIEAQTNRMAGNNKGIVNEAITLKVFSPHVVNLTLVDLPGITKVPVGDQPADIEDQIHKLISHYIANPTAIILAVITANTDMATNESLKMAREFDPLGERTLAVVTKIDLMDRGTDAREILRGKVIPVKLGIVGVVNRSQKDITEKKSMKEAQGDEEKFFQKYYSEIASEHGSSYLAKRLSDLLALHVNICLPAVKGKMNDEIIRCMRTLSDLGESVTDKKATLMSVINQFSRDFSKCCETGPRDIKSTKLSAGAKICDILHRELKRTFASFDPCLAYNREQVITAVRQSNGLKPPFFVSEATFELLLIPQIKKMELPALLCVEEVKKEILDICQLCIPDEVQLRFPDLKQALVKVAQNVLEKTSQKPIEMVRRRA